MSVPPLIDPQWSWVYAVLVGQQWPQGDEDKLRGAAQAWTDAINGLLTIADGGNATARNVNYSVQAVSAEQFNTYWDQWVDGDDSYLGELAKQCEVLASNLLQQAQETEYTKWTIDITVVIVIVQLVIMLALAAATAGGSLTGWALAITIGRQAVIEAILRFVEQVIAAVLPDVIAQTIMMADGHESGWDWGKTGQAVAGGVVGGVVGSVAGAAGGKLFGKAIEDIATDGVGGKLGKLLAETTVHSAEGAFTNSATSLITAGGASIAQSIADKDTPDKIWSNFVTAEGQAVAGLPGQALSGAGMGAAFHLAHTAGSALSPYHGPVTTMTLDNGRQVRAYQSADGYKVVDENGFPIGTGAMADNHSSFTLDRAGGQSQTIDLTKSGYSVTDPHGTTVTHANWNTDLRTHTDSYTTHTTSADLPVTNPDGSVTTIKAGATVTHQGDVTGPVIQADVPKGSSVQRFTVGQDGNLAPAGWQRNTTLPVLGTVHTDYLTADGDQVASHNGWTNHMNVTDQAAYHNTFGNPADRTHQPSTQDANGPGANDTTGSTSTASIGTPTHPVTGGAAEAPGHHDVVEPVRAESQPTGADSTQSPVPSQESTSTDHTGTGGPGRRPSGSPAQGSGDGRVTLGGGGQLAAQPAEPINTAMTAAQDIGGLFTDPDHPIHAELRRFTDELVRSQQIAGADRPLPADLVGQLDDFGDLAHDMIAAGPSSDPVRVADLVDAVSAHADRLTELNDRFAGFAAEAPGQRPAFASTPHGDIPIPDIRSRDEHFVKMGRQFDNGLMLGDPSDVVGTLVLPVAASYPPPEPGHFQVVMHGMDGRVLIGTEQWAPRLAGGGWERVNRLGDVIDGVQLGKILVQYDGFRQAVAEGKPLWLDVCQAGLSLDGHTPAAQQLADIFGVPVTAALGDVRIGLDGSREVWQFVRDAAGNRIRTQDVPPEYAAIRLDDGEAWQVFQPRKNAALPPDWTSSPTATTPETGAVTRVLPEIPGNKLASRTPPPEGPVHLGSASPDDPVLPHALPPEQPPPSPLAVAADRLTRLVNTYGGDTLLGPALREAQAAVRRFNDRLALARDAFAAHPELLGSDGPASRGVALLDEVRRAADGLAGGRTGVELDRLATAVSALKESTVAFGAHYGELTGWRDLGSTRVLQRTDDLLTRLRQARPEGLPAVDRLLARSRQVLTELRGHLDGVRAEPGADALGFRARANSAGQSLDTLRRYFEQVSREANPRLTDLIGWDRALQQLENTNLGFSGGDPFHPPTLTQDVRYAAAVYRVRWEPQVRGGVLRMENVRIEPLHPGDGLPMPVGDPRRISDGYWLELDELRGVLAPVLAAHYAPHEQVQLDIVDSTLSANRLTDVVFTNSHALLGEQPPPVGHEELLARQQAEQQALADALDHRVQQLTYQFGPKMPDIALEVRESHYQAVRELAARHQLEWRQETARSGAPTVELAAAHHEFLDRFGIPDDTRSPGQQAHDELRSVLEQARAHELSRLDNAHAANTADVRAWADQRRAELDLAAGKAARRALTPEARAAVASRLAEERARVAGREQGVRERYQRRREEINAEYDRQLSELSAAADRTQQGIPARDDPTVRSWRMVRVDNLEPFVGGQDPAAYLRQPIRFEVRETADTIYAIVHADLRPLGIGPEHLALVRARAQLGLEEFVNRRLAVDDVKMRLNGKTLQAKVNFDLTGIDPADVQRLSVNPPPLGAYTEADQVTVHVSDSAEIIAHELMHTLGLPDNYHSPGAYTPGRETPWSELIRQRGSLMGPARALPVDRAILADHVTTIGRWLDTAAGPHQAPIPIPSDKTARPQMRQVFDALSDMRRRWGAQGPSLRLLDPLAEQFAAWPRDGTLTAVHQPAADLIDVVNRLEQRMRTAGATFDQPSLPVRGLLESLRAHAGEAAQRLSALENAVHEYTSWLADGDSEQATRAAQQLNDLVQPIRESAAALGRESDLVELFAGGPPPLPPLGGSPPRALEHGAFNRMNELRTDLVPPVEQATPVGHTPPAARVEQVVVEGDHLRVQLSDGVHTGQMRVDTSGDRMVFRSLDEAGDALGAVAGTLKAPDGTFTIVSHADANGIVVDGMHVPFEEVTQFLPELPEGTTIRMFGCEAGAGDAIAGLLTGHDVIATSADVWLDPRTGNAVAAHSTTIDGRPVPVLRPDGEGHLVGDGAWELHHREADGQVVHHALPPDDPRLPDGHIDSPDAALLRLAHADEMGYIGIFGPDDSVMPPEVHDFARRTPLELRRDDLNVALWSLGDGLLRAESGRDTFPKFVQDRRASALDDVPLQDKIERRIARARREVALWTEENRKAQVGELGKLTGHELYERKRNLQRAQDRQAYWEDELGKLTPNQLTAKPAAKSRPAEHPLVEAAAMYLNQKLPEADRLWADSRSGDKRVEETIVSHGIPAEVTWGKGGTLGETAVFVPGRERGSELTYGELVTMLTEYRGRHPGGGAAFDEQFGRAVRELAGRPGSSPPRSVRELAAALSADPAEAGVVQRQLAAFALLQTTLEGARGPSALLTNLMVWDMVADGHVSLSDALGYLNVMGPQGSVEVGKIDAGFNQTGAIADSDLHGTTQTNFRKDLRAGLGVNDKGEPLKKIDPSAVDRMTRLLNQYGEVRAANPAMFDPTTGLPLVGKVDGLATELARAQLRERLREFQARQREIVALYAIKNNLVPPSGDMVKALDRYFHADQRTGAPAAGRPNEALGEVFGKLRQKLEWTP